MEAMWEEVFRLFLRDILEMLPVEDLGSVRLVSKEWAASVRRILSSCCWQVQASATFSQEELEVKNLIHLSLVLPRSRDGELSVKSMPLDFLMEFVSRQNVKQGFGPLTYESCMAYDHESNLACFLFASWQQFSAVWTVFVCDLFSRQVKVLPSFESYGTVAQGGMAIVLDKNDTRRYKILVPMISFMGFTPWHFLSVLDSSRNGWEEIDGTVEYYVNGLITHGGEWYGLKANRVVKYDEQEDEKYQIIVKLGRAVTGECRPIDIRLEKWQDGFLVARYDPTHGLLRLLKVVEGNFKEIACLRGIDDPEVFDPTTVKFSIKARNDKVYIALLKPTKWYKLMEWSAGAWKQLLVEEDQEKYTDLVNVQLV